MILKKFLIFGNLSLDDSYKLNSYKKSVYYLPTIGIQADCVEKPEVYEAWIHKPCIRCNLLYHIRICLRNVNTMTTGKLGRRMVINLRVICSKITYIYNTYTNYTYKTTTTTNVFDWCLPASYPLPLVHLK